MSDIEKVVKGLECCMTGDGVVPNCEECPYTMVGNNTCDSVAALFGDALALLKAQEPKVMTLDEARTALHNDSIVWIELKDKLIAAGIRMDETDYFLMQNDDVLNITDLDWEDMENEYGKRVRVWTAEPSEEQRKGTSWN